MKLLFSVLVICLTQSSLLGQIDVKVVAAPTRLDGETESEFRERRATVLDEERREDERQALQDAIVVAAGVPLLSRNSPEIDVVRTFYRDNLSIITDFHKRPPNNKTVLKIVNEAIERRSSILKTCLTTSPLRSSKQAEVLRAECEWEDKLCTALDELYTPEEMEELCCRSKILKGLWMTSKIVYLRCGDMSKEDFAYMRKCKLAQANELFKKLADPSYSMDPRSLPRPTKRLTVKQFETVLHLFRDIKPDETIDDFWARLSPTQQRGISNVVPSLGRHFTVPKDPAADSQ